MLDGKIYYWWSSVMNQFSPSAMEYDEDIRQTPRQGNGLYELAGWLSNDIQYSINSVDIWIKNLTNSAIIKDVNGNFGIGNAHWVMVEEDKVFIECEYSEEQKVLLTIEQALYILAQYRSFLEGNYTNPDMPPEPIDVEYIAEGEEAAELYEILRKANL